ncbi:MAG: competence/damage-inducible protein A [Candidatus Freyarchaeota archaeon]|nr:competence/damage-inducible protein A [Candidatus Jordarchaeia archaeon]MBS7270443.1 competence/damage-inducible protein A [Candidatus Jordarchaeia archaeon]MBS7278330.1 competence/damage-inducible protein A [Candidatus Jordarchaeia archaeon]
MTGMEIIVIGNEVLAGRVQDTNSHYICSQAAVLGIEVKRVTIIPDDLEIITSVLREAVSRKPDFVITTGGLGSTYDDMTLKALASAVNRPLEVNLELLKDLEKKFELIYQMGRAKHKEMTKERKKLAYVPKGSQTFLNPVGLAPATMVQIEETKVISLPGFPQEVKALFEKYLVSLLKETVKEQYVEECITTEVLIESDLSPLIDQVREKHPQVWIKSQPQRDQKITAKIYLSARGKNADAAVQTAKKELEEKITEYKGKVIGKTNQNNPLR